MSANVVLGCVMALLIILFTISSIARYYIKFTLFSILCLVYALTPLPYFILRPFDPRNALWPAALLRFSATVLGLRYEVRGKENIVNDRGTVVLINHQSVLDLFVLAVLWPMLDGATVVAKRSLQYLAPFGTAAWLWGTVYIDRGAKSARDAMNKQSEAIKVQKRKLLLFPEGTRNTTDKLLPLRKGAFHVALDSNAPIQPVVVSKYHFLDGSRHKFGSGDIIISILPIIESKDYSKDDIDVLVEKCQNIMGQEFAKTSKETKERLQAQMIKQE